MAGECPGVLKLGRAQDGVAGVQSGDLPIARCRKYSFGFKFSWPLCSRLGDGTERNDAHVFVNNNNGDKQSSLPFTGTSVLDAPMSP